MLDVPELEFVRHQAAATYNSVMFVLAQGADLLLPAMKNGEQMYRYAVLTGLAGFPVAVALAWVFDIKKGRLVRTALDTVENPQRKRLEIAGVFISVAFAAAIAAWYLRG